MCFFGASCSFISIHALRGEGDAMRVPPAFIALSDFNPRPPWGGRPMRDRGQGLLLFISIHALRGEGDLIIL